MGEVLCGEPARRSGFPAGPVRLESPTYGILAVRRNGGNGGDFGRRLNPDTESRRELYSSSGEEAARPPPRPVTRRRRLSNANSTGAVGHGDGLPQVQRDL